MTEFTSVGDDFNRHKDLMLAIDKAFSENEDLLENIASDYDDGFVCYSEDDPS
jgi:hypothetical protein